MSIRTLIEINHDNEIDIEVLAALQQYRRSGHPDDAERLEDMGVRVIASRHHADDYRIPAGAWGFAK